MIKFNGEEWRVYLVSPFHSQLKQDNGAYALGVCDDFTKTIYINNSLNNHYMKKVLAHELTHAAAFSYNIMLNYDEHEMLADFVATHGNKILQTTNNIFEQIK